jgi:hypothetical protein
VSMIRPFVLFVVGNLATTPPSAATVAQLKGAGLNALSLECQEPGTEGLLVWARSSLIAARKVARSIIVYRASSDDFDQLAAFGATHVSPRVG